MKKLILKRKDGNNVEVELKLLDLTYVDKIMEIQHKIYDGLENKEFYSCSDKEEFVDTLNGTAQL